MMSFLMSFGSALPGAAAQGSIWGLMAIGVYITFRVLDIADLTVDGSFGTGGAVLVFCVTNGMNVYLAMIIAFLAGCLAGFVTGIFHTSFGIPAILAGILTQLALYSINLRILGNKANKTLSARKYNLLVSLGDINQSLIVGAIFSVVLIAVLYWFFGTELGHSIRATGNNQAMSRANGINTNVNKIIGLVLSNGIVALAGGLYSQYQGLKSGISLVKNGADSAKNEVNAVTGATITSTAVNKAVNTALKQFESVKSIKEVTEGE